MDLLHNAFFFQISRYCYHFLSGFYNKTHQFSPMISIKCPSLYKYFSNAPKIHTAKLSVQCRLGVGYYIQNLFLSIQNRSTPVVDYHEIKHLFILNFWSKTQEYQLSYVLNLQGFYSVCIQVMFASKEIQAIKSSISTFQ